MLKKDENNRSSSKQLMDKIKEQSKFKFDEVKNFLIRVSYNQMVQKFFFRYLTMKY